MLGPKHTPVRGFQGLCGALILGTALTGGCWGGDKPDPEAKAPAAEARKPEPAAPASPQPALLMVQAHFVKQGGMPKPLPARLSILRLQPDGSFTRENIDDPDSNVLHKAVAWREGILTIGGSKAALKYWTRAQDGRWSAQTLWETSFGGKFDRLRDLEIGDVDGDGRDEIVLATHDQGVVAVGHEGDDGTWSFAEFDRKPDTFVHEIEIGDVDGDGKKEFYATPSDRNRSSGASQPGLVVRYDYVGGTFKRSIVAEFADSHAKEILVTDTDGDGKDELYVVREAHTVQKDGGQLVRVDPVRIVRYDVKGAVGAQTWTPVAVASLDDDQCRFLVPGDVDGDGKIDLVAAGYRSGLWRLVPQLDHTFKSELIDADSGGFEHTTHVADLDGDGKLEIYVAADTQGKLRRYEWSGDHFERTDLLTLAEPGETAITWNLQDGVR